MQTLSRTIKALLAAPVVLGLPLGQLQAAPVYTTTDLGTLEGQYSAAIGLSETGQVVGASSSIFNASLQAFNWREGAVALEAIPSLGGSHGVASGVNRAGLVVGNAYTTGDAALRAFVWSGTGLTELPTLGGSTGRARAINDAGQIVGAAATTGDAAERGVVWPSATAQNAIALPTLGGSNSEGNDINAAGSVVGYAETAIGATHAALWTPPYGAPRDLGTFGGGSYSEAYAINANGQVVGVSGNGTQLRGFLWTATGGLSDIGTLTTTSTETAGYDINSAGDVVGYSTTTAGAARRAVIRKAGGSLTDLNTLILPVTGLALTEARAINDAGQIVGIAARTVTDPLVNVTRAEFHAVLLTPDKVLPTITCPISIKTTGIQPASIGQATATDNLSTTTDIAISSSPALPFVFPNGDTTVTWTAKDAAGNAATCTQVVTIAADTTPPTVAAVWTSAGAAATANAAGWYNKLPLALGWSVADAESAISSRVGCAAGFQVIADTAASASQSCSATSLGGTTGPVTTSIKVDATAPTFAATAPVSADITTAFEAATVTYVTPAASDATSGVDTASVSCSPTSGSSFKLGANTVTCDAKDLAGNAATPASFTVTVRDPSAPVVVPTVTGPAGTAGWFKGPTTVSFAVSDAQSTITAKDPACDTVTTLSTDGASQPVTCSATSAGGPRVVTRTVSIDATPPTVTPPANVVAEATGPTGAAVSFSGGSVSDLTSGPVSAVPTCLPPPGSYPLGSTPVKCTGSDNAGNLGEASFTVTVQDTTKPSLSLPLATVSASTTDPNGTTVSYAASASDAVSGSLIPSCSQPSGSVFPIGTTTVSCSATDAAGNSAAGSFAVTVTQTTTPPPGDTVPPVLSLPADIVTTATSEAGAIVGFTATAIDAVSGPVNVTCNPAADTLFGVGTWPVSCSATDASGNTATGQFSVTVNPLPPVVTTTDAAIAGNPATINNVRRDRNATYTFRVSNVATTGTLTGATFAHTLPSNVSTFSSATTTGGTCTQANRVVTCTLAALAPGAGVNVSVTARMPNNRTTVVATGNVAATNDTNATNNTATVTLNVTQ